ncbi:MAG: tRNA glutamyl-Q(34) synthetase GluQRS [Piscirickettsiaceae bacterium]|nr:MAG: tRNA glutamyl-Q(34) synthetase GluQRS [Piscirickettsiaceae bacterium]
MSISSYRGRFAPSPTGPLHLGSLYTAVASYCQARANKGYWLVRMDDLDSTRCRSTYASQILNSLECFGLHYDESILYQSTRSEAYQDALSTLNTKGLTYPCDCSRKELQQRLQSNPSNIYDGHCLIHPPTNNLVSIRLSVNKQRINFEDQIQGTNTWQLNENLGDFIIYRKDKIFSYHLATCIDDEEQRISDVLRGNDLLESTAGQIYIQQQLRLNTPKYTHIPVIVDKTGAKLSKQTFATDVSQLNIEKTLLRVLTLLQLAPPSYLAKCNKHEILNWAVAHWSLDQLKKRETLQENTNDNE